MIEIWLTTSGTMIIGEVKENDQPIIENPGFLSPVGSMILLSQFLKKPVYINYNDYKDKFILRSEASDKIQEAYKNMISNIGGRIVRPIH